MLIINNLKYRLLFMVLIVSGYSYGQNEWVKEDAVVELEDVQVEIVKDREITLPKAIRNFEKIPPQPLEKNLTQLTYEFQNYNFEVPPLVFKLRPLKTKPQPIQKLYNGYIKAGLGNYITPYAEGFFSNKRDKRYNYGIHLKHLSSKNGPIDDSNSGVGESSARIYGLLFSRKITMGAGAFYSNRQNHLYGYNIGNIINSEDIEHNFNQFGLNANISSNDTPVKYQLGLNYFYINDNKFLTENEFRVKLNTEFDVNKTSTVSIGGGLHYITQNDSLYKNHDRILAYIAPQYHFRLNEVDVAIGVNLTYAEDTLSKLSKFRLYPMLDARYEISKGIDINAYFKGSTVTQSYRELSHENAFIKANNTVHFSNNLYSLGLAMNAKVGGNTLINAGIDYSSYKNHLFYMNDTIDPSQFVLAYDTGSISIANFFGSINFTNNSTIHMSVRGDYYSYATDVLQEAWHKPQYKIGIQGIFNFYKKIVVTTDLALLGGIKALITTNTTIELDPIIDFNLKLEYLFTDRFSTFIQLKNIFGQNYELYNRYPVKGFQVIGGISYSF